jgi:FkbM family methyltransferase
MLKTFKNIISGIVAKIGYELVPKKLNDFADDPIAVLGLLLQSEEVSVIIDGGASIGDTSQKFSHLFPDANIFAFEPYPPFWDALKKKKEVNSRIKDIPLALDNKPGVRTLNVNKSEGTNSFYEASENSKKIYQNHFEKKKELQVNATTLDIWCNEQSVTHIDILKLDLQGGEYAALEGAVSKLKNKEIHYILSEISFISQYNEQPIASDVINFLDSFGYDMLNLYQIHYYGGCIIQADAIFVDRTYYIDKRAKNESLFFPYSRLPLHIR